MSSKTAIKSIAAKATKVRLSEDDKAADPDNYILNPVSRKYVSRTSATGKKVIKAQEEGIDLKPALTKVKFGIAIVEAIQSAMPEITDAVIKKAIKEAEIVLPRSFPKKWGGSGKSKSGSTGNGIKKAQSAYNFFVATEGKKLKAENPDENMMRLCSAAWKKVSAAKRRKYDQMAAKDKARYIKECKEQGVPVTPPKKPSKTNGYRIYCAETKSDMAEQYPDDKPKEINKKVAAEWKSLTDEEQAEWNAKADEANEDLDDRIAKWERENPDAVKAAKEKVKAKPTKKVRPPLDELSDKEREKAEDSDTYIWNPDSGRHVKRDSKKGKEIIRTEGGSAANSPKSTNEVKNNEIEDDVFGDDDNDLFVDDE